MIMEEQRSCTDSMMIGVAVLLTLLQLASCLTLPENWKRCHRSDPQVNSCLKAAVQDAFINIASTGVPDLGLEPIEPLDVGRLELQQKGKGGPVSLKISLKNVVVHGLSASTVKKFDAHLDKYILDGETFTPNVHIEADYVMDGQILVLPVKGKGRCNITFSGMKTTHDLHGQLNERNGKKFMDLTEYNVDIVIEKLHGYFANLFNGDKALGQTLNKVINENSQLIFNEIKPSLEKGLSIVFRDYANKIFSQVPFDDIFLS